MTNDLPAEMHAHYAATDEAARLSTGVGELERVRTQELLKRYLPPAPMVILDVGGGAGVHALWLAQEGHAVHLIDPVARHVAQAREASGRQARTPLASCETGDARQLQHPDESADAVLLLGPLYHLTDRADRLKALTEARRVLRPGGVIFAAGISRLASLLNGMAYDLFGDPVFVKIIRQDLKDGQHRNPTDNPQYFTTTFFHRPEDLGTEIREAGFRFDRLVAIEGPAMWMQGFEADWQDPRKRALHLEFLRLTEEDPAIIGTSSHFIGIARK